MDDINTYTKLHDRIIVVELMYPRIPDRPSSVEVGLCDVRCADNITIQYDFDRDGWSITREVHIKEENSMAATGEIREVAFIEAWTLRKQIT